LPPLDLNAEDARPFAEGLVRVLNDQHQAVGPWAEILDELSPAAMIEGLRDMLTMRMVDKRLLLAQRQGKTSFYMQCTGEEAIGCAFARQLDKGDMNFPTYRQQSLLVASGYPLEKLMGQVYSNALDPMAGRQLPVLHASREYGYFTVSGNLGTQYVQAVGWAMANALLGDGSIAAAWIGDGATAANDFHSALVTASAYQPPVILNVVNNQWAISTYTGVATGASHTYAERILGYGIPALRVDGNDYLAVTAVCRWAVERARKGFGPVGIEWYTYRAAAHSSSDDPTGYRPKDEAQAWPLGDPIERLKQHLIAQGHWSDEQHLAAEQDISERVAKTQKAVEAKGTLLDQTAQSPEAIFDGVYASMPPHLARQKRELEQAK
jgi:2-oxoisovalerate dehydrogenase E1 component alpha subunit